MNEATDSVKAIVRNVLNGVRTEDELHKCWCGDCQAAFAILQEEKAKACEKELEKDLEKVCRCCGKRPGKRVGPSYSRNYLCGPCMMDPSETVEGCKHGEED